VTVKGRANKGSWAVTPDSVRSRWGRSASGTTSSWPSSRGSHQGAAQAARNAGWRQTTSSRSVSTSRDACG
jgi:hypothetical protein